MGNGKSINTISKADTRAARRWSADILLTLTEN